MSEQTAAAETTGAETGAQENAVSTAGTQNQAETGAQAATESFINPDGSLKEGWQNSNLIPDDFKGRKVYSALGAKPTYADLLKHIGHQDIAISKQGKGIFVPAADATQTEKDMFFKAIGRPDTPQGYENAIKAAIPKGMESVFDDPEAMSELTTEMHKVGATPPVVATAIGIYAKQVARAQEQMKADPMPFYEEILPLVQPIFKKAMDEYLDKQWGDMKQPRMHLFQRAVVENVPEGEQRDLLLVTCEQNPHVMDFVATMMNKHFTSGMGPDTSTGSPGGAVNSDQRIEEIIEQLTPQLKRTNPSKYDALLKEKSRLFSSRYPEPGKP